MKKLFLTVILIFGIGKYLVAGVDKLESQRPAVWRSSYTDITESFVLITSGAVIIHSIIVDSPTINTGNSFVSLYNSTTSAGTFNFNISTGAMLNTDMTTPNGNIPPAYFDLYFASGVVINKVGAAKVQVIWDYVVPYDYYLVPWRP